jgi:hypothetical protein
MLVAAMRERHTIFRGLPDVKGSCAASPPKAKTSAWQEADSSEG